MTIHRIGKNPKAAPSRPALKAWPAGIEYAKTATTRETTSETSAAFQAVIRATPSRTNSVSRGSMATSAVRASDPAQGIENWAIHGSPCLWKEWGSTRGFAQGFALVGG